MVDLILLVTLQQRQWVEELPPMKTARSETAVVSTSDGKYVLVIGGLWWLDYYS